MKIALFVLLVPCMSVVSKQDITFSPPLRKCPSVFIVSFTTLLTGFAESYGNLLKPGVLPPLIGSFTFDTVLQLSFPLSNIFPSTTRLISVMVCIYSRYDFTQDGVPFNVWLWTECDGGVRDIKLKRGYRRAQDAISFDSETFDFAYCPTNPRLYLMSDAIGRPQNTGIELFAVRFDNF
jgi:hypothetical protein